MGRIRALLSGVLALSVLGALLASAAASGAVVLKGGGQVAPVGTPALGRLEFGPCGTFTSHGALVTNSSAVDSVRFKPSSGGGGACGEGGPIISGKLIADRVREDGRLVVAAKIIYTTTLNQYCHYSLKTLVGPLTIPGQTKSVVAGTGTLIPEGSDPGCPETKHVGYVEAALYDLSTNELFETEL